MYICIYIYIYIYMIIYYILCIQAEGVAGVEVVPEIRLLETEEFGLGGHRFSNIFIYIYIHILYIIYILYILYIYIIYIYIIYILYYIIYIFPKWSMSQMGLCF